MGWTNCRTERFLMNAILLELGECFALPQASSESRKNSLRRDSRLATNRRHETRCATIAPIIVHFLVSKSRIDCISEVGFAAGPVAESVDATDLKSVAPKGVSRFKSGRGHQSPPRSGGDCRAEAR